MYKIISFSVWGNSKNYLNGCIENINIAKKIYPDWQTRFYCDSLLPNDFISKLNSMGAETVIMKTEKSNWEGLFWRFFPAAEENVDVFISRDIDSILNEREKAAVDEWLSDGKQIHCMRDHIEHNVPILGGMWGCRKGSLRDIVSYINRWNKHDYKGSDQDFLKEEIWRPFKDCILTHDKYYNGITIEQVVVNIEEFYKQREDYIEYRDKTIKAKEKYIKETNNTNINDINSIFPEIPEPKPIKFNSEGRIIIDYVYDPVSLFGKHDIRPFPKYKKISNCNYVGERVFHDKQLID